MKRLALLPLTLLGITFVTFLLLHLAPGDPAAVRAGTGRGVSPESIAALRQEYGLDRPLMTQYLDWLSRSARLDFGRSFVDGRPVRARIGEALPVTLGLSLLAVSIAYLLAVPLGCLLALGERRPGARALSLLLALLYATPTVAIGRALLSLGAPWGGRSFASMFVAALCLSLTTVIRISRQQRSSLLSALRSDYLVTARAKGGGPAALLRHALRNALLPVLTLLGTELGALLSGSVIIEQLFAYPGMGRLMYEAMLERDVPIIMVELLIGSSLVLVGNLLADILYSVVDPRVRLE